MIVLPLEEEVQSFAVPAQSTKTPHGGCPSWKSLAPLRIAGSAFDLIQVLKRAERQITERLLSSNRATEAVITNVSGWHVLAFQTSSCTGADGCFSIAPRPERQPLRAAARTS